MISVYNVESEEYGVLYKIVTADGKHIPIKSDRGEKDILVQNGEIIKGSYNFNHGCAASYNKEDRLTSQHFDAHESSLEEKVRELCLDEVYRDYWNYGGTHITESMVDFFNQSHILDVNQVTME